MELDNFRLACGKAVVGDQADVELGLSLIGGTANWWAAFAPWEGITRLQELLEFGADAPGLHRARALRTVGEFLTHHADPGASRPCLEEGLLLSRELGDVEGVLRCLTALCNGFIHEGDFERASVLARSAHNDAVKAGQPRNIARALASIGRLAQTQGHVAEARSRYEALALYPQSAEDFDAGNTMLELGLVIYHQGDRSLARTHYEQGLEILERVGHTSMMGLHRLGALDLFDGKYVAARRSFRRILLQIKDGMGTVGSAPYLESMARLERLVNRPARAARLMGAADTVREQTHSPRSVAGRLAYESHDALLRDTLGEEAYAALREEGRK